MKTLMTSIAALTLMTGMAVAGEGPGRGPGHPWMEKALTGLSEQDRAAFKEGMKAGHEKAKLLHEQLKKQEEEQRALLSAATFDKAAYIAKSGEISKLRAQLHSAMTESFANTVANFPQSERAALAASFPPKGPRGGKPADKPDAAPVKE